MNSSANWQRTTLGALVAARGKSVDPSKYPNDQFELYSVPSFPEREPELIAGKEVGSNKQEVHPRSVLLCKINPRINRAWVVGDFSKHPKIASTEWIIFPENEAIEPSFLSYFLQQNAVRDFLAANASGVGGSLMRVKPSTLRDFPFAYPQRKEQQRIVLELEKQFTRLDAGVAALHRVRAALKRYRASVLKAACEGRLVPTEAELVRQGHRSYETGEQLLQRILKERRQKWNEKWKYKEPIARSILDLPKVPEGWTWATWNQLSEWVTYGFTRPMPHVDTGIPIVTAKNIKNSKIDFATSDVTTREAYQSLSDKDRPQRGDILITKDGTIGRAAVVDSPSEFCINQSVAVVWLRACVMNRRFLLAVIESDTTQKPIWAKARGVAIKHLSITDFAKMPVPIPPLPEQERIVTEVERRLSVIEELELLVNANLQRGSRVRQAVLQRAFSGELTRGREHVHMNN